MQLPKVERTSDWILLASMLLLILGVTGGAYGIETLDGREDHAIAIGGILLFVWIMLKFHADKIRPPTKRTRKTDNEPDAG